jgi:hypothetical protein
MMEFFLDHNSFLNLLLYIFCRHLWVCLAQTRGEGDFNGGEGKGGERFNRLLFAWLRGVEGERFYLRIFQSMCLNFINPSLPS